MYMFSKGSQILWWTHTKETTDRYLFEIMRWYQSNTIPQARRNHSPQKAHAVEKSRVPQSDILLAWLGQPILQLSYNSLERNARWVAVASAESRFDEGNSVYMAGIDPQELSTWCCSSPILNSGNRHRASASDCQSTIDALLAIASMEFRDYSPSRFPPSLSQVPIQLSDASQPESPPSSGTCTWERSEQSAVEFFWTKYPSVTLTRTGFFVTLFANLNLGTVA